MKFLIAIVVTLVGFFTYESVAGQDRKRIIKHLELDGNEIISYARSPIALPESKPGKGTTYLVQYIDTQGDTRQSIIQHSSSSGIYVASDELLKAFEPERVARPVGQLTDSSA